MWLSERYNLAIGLSGGLDSRLTFCAATDIRHKELFFTYYSRNNPILSVDIEVARELAATFSLKHLEFPISEGGVKDNFDTEEWKRITDGILGPPGLARQYNRYIGNRYLHIRSNILEIVRGFYLKNKVNHKNNISSHKLSRLFRVATAEEFTPIFQDYMDKTEFNEGSMKGYHYTDIFYWEHRMGAWLGPSIRSTRMVFDTYILYNCRLLLKVMMAQPLEERVSASVIFDIMAELSPESLRVPIFSGSKYIEIPSNLQVE